jgi:hypothetical protein
VDGDLDKLWPEGYLDGRSTSTLRYVQRSPRDGHVSHISEQILLKCHPGDFVYLRAFSNISMY